MSKYFCMNLSNSIKMGPYDKLNEAQEYGIMKFGIGNFIIERTLTPMIDNHLKYKLDLKKKFTIRLSINDEELKALEYIAKIHELESIERVLYKSIENFVEFYKENNPKQ